MTTEPGPEFALAELAGLRAGDRPLEETLAALATLTTRLVPRAVGATLTVHAPARFLAGTAGRSDDVDQDGISRVRVALAIPLRAGEQVIGAMTVYSDPDSDGLGEESVLLAELLADGAATVVGNAIQRPTDGDDLVLRLRMALRDRELVERATGLLMARYDCSARDASMLLLHTAGDRGITAAEVADHLLTSAESRVAEQHPADLLGSGAPVEVTLDRRRSG